MACPSFNLKIGAPLIPCCNALSGILAGVTSQNRLGAPHYPLFKPQSGILNGASIFGLEENSTQKEGQTNHFPTLGMRRTRTQKMAVPTKEMMAVERI